MKKEATCRGCSRAFRVDTYKERYCSSVCRLRCRAERKRDRDYFRKAMSWTAEVCEECGESFQRSYVAGLRRRRFCRECVRERHLRSCANWKQLHPTYERDRKRKRKGLGRCICCRSQLSQGQTSARVRYCRVCAREKKRAYDRQRYKLYDTCPEFRARKLDAMRRSLDRIKRDPVRLARKREYQKAYRSDPVNKARRREWMLERVPKDAREALGLLMDYRALLRKRAIA